MTYWVGITPVQCNSTTHSLTATDNLQLKTARKMVIQPRLVTIYEACYWIITAPESSDDSMIDVWVNKTNRGEFWIYAGKDRHNVTAVTMGNNTAQERDEPYRVPAKLGVVVVFMTEKTLTSSSSTYGGSGAFSYKVSGGGNSFYHRATALALSKQDPQVYLAAIAGGSLVLLCLAILCCICCGCCKKEENWE